MRVSVRSTDPGYRHFRPMRTHAFLNGEEVTHRCITADEEAGEVLLGVFDADGAPVLTEDFEFETEVLHGHVVVRIDEEPTGSLLSRSDGQSSEAFTAVAEVKPITWPM